MIGKTLVALASVSFGLGANALAADVTSESSAASLVPKVQESEAHRPSGYLELYGQVLWNDPDSGYNPWLGGGVAARGNVWLARAWSAQFDISGNSVSPSQDPSGYGAVSTFTTAAHLSFRDPSRGLLGGFVGVTGTNDCCGTGQDGSTFAGLEAQYYLNHVTLYGQVGGLHQYSGTYGGGPPGDPAYNINIWFAQATARFFPQPNTKLEASLGYLSGTIWGTLYYGSDYSARAMTFAAEAEHRFANCPVSVFGRVSGFSDPTYTSGPSFEYAAVAGIKVNFGAGTLEDQDRNGATLKVVDFDPIGWLRWDD